MKESVYLLCKDCAKVFITSNEYVGDKDLACSCKSKLFEVSKDEAMRVFLENQNEED